MVGPQRSEILSLLVNTLFISHTSLDDAFITGAADGGRGPEPESIWWICGQVFHDPFYHSRRTGGAESYERIVGLALLASRHVLVIWSQNAVLSKYVRAEMLIATEENKTIGTFMAPGAPTFPMPDVPLVYDNDGLRLLLTSWR